MFAVFKKTVALSHLPSILMNYQVRGLHINVNFILKFIVFM